MTPRGLIPIDYQDGDVALQGELALPTGDGPHPGVLVMHSGLGLGEQARVRAQSLAGHGYAAFAMDMYGRDMRGAPPEEAGKSMAGLNNDPDRLRARIRAGFDTFAALSAVNADRIGAIGFCFGGMCVLELARSGADVKAVASFHGLLSTRKPAAPGAIKGHVAIFTGAKDPYAPASDVAALRAELTAAGANWQITEYGTGYHAFMGPADPIVEAREGMAFDPLLDAQSWASTLTLLNATLRNAVSSAHPPMQVH